MVNEQTKIKEKYDCLKSCLNEKQRRLYAWVEAKTLWYWWIEIVSKATWLARNTVKRWKKEIENNDAIVSSNSVRKSWWWRQKEIDKHPEIGKQIEKQLDWNTIWDPMSLLTRTTKSLTNLSNAIEKITWLDVGRNVICRYLKWNWYSLQWNRKVNEWWDCDDRDDQFVFIKNKAEEFVKLWDPVISVDTKKKELVWNFKNWWKERYKEWESPKVNVYDFIDKKKWKVSPYWIYDIINNKWRINVWISLDTAKFSVQSIRVRRNTVWKTRYPNAKKIYINCDWWWSNWSKNRLWKYELQLLSDEVGIEIHVSHFPPWTSKRNKIEHRLFCHITQNRRWKPLQDLATVINLISNTKTSKWLTVEAVLDKNIYEKWIEVTDEQFKSISIKFVNDLWKWNCRWNYVIYPRNS